MTRALLFSVLCSLFCTNGAFLPLVINTWGFENSTIAGESELNESGECETGLSHLSVNQVSLNQSDENG